MRRCVVLAYFSNGGLWIWQLKSKSAIYVVRLTIHEGKNCSVRCYLMKNHIAMKKAQEQRAFEQECSLNSYLTGQQRLQNFLSDGTQGSADMMNFQSTAMGAI